jgi:hypothetical protein
VARKPSRSQWADHYSIDLGPQSEQYLDRVYAGAH